MATFESLYFLLGGSFQFQNDIKVQEILLVEVDYETNENFAAKKNVLIVELDDYTYENLTPNRYKSGFLTTFFRTSELKCG